MISKTLTKKGLSIYAFLIALVVLTVIASVPAFAVRLIGEEQSMDNNANAPINLGDVSFIGENSNNSEQSSNQSTDVNAQNNTEDSSTTSAAGGLLAAMGALTGAYLVGSKKDDKPTEARMTYEDWRKYSIGYRHPKLAEYEDYEERFSAEDVGKDVEPSYYSALVKLSKDSKKSPVLGYKQGETQDALLIASGEYH